jgi:hypothetical protein
MVLFVVYLYKKSPAVSANDNYLSSGSVKDTKNPVIKQGELGQDSEAYDEDGVGVPSDVLDFEAKVRQGLGDRGSGVSLPKEQTDEDIQAQMKKHSFNKYVSDVISLKRELPDTRHQSCRTLGKSSGS